jgi:hypothetical protein
MTAGRLNQELWSGNGLRVESRRYDYGSEVWTDQRQTDSFGVQLPIGGAYRLAKRWPHAVRRLTSLEVV